MNVETNKLEGVNISERAGNINKDKNFVTIKCKFLMRTESAL